MTNWSQKCCVRLERNKQNIKRTVFTSVNHKFGVVRCAGCDVCQCPCCFKLKELKPYKFQVDEKIEEKKWEENGEGKRRKMMVKREGKSREVRSMKTGTRSNLSDGIPGLCLS